MNITIDDLDQLKDHISKEIEAAFQKQIDPLIKRIEGAEEKVKGVEDFKKRVTRLEGNQAKALVGFSVLVTGVTLIVEQGKDWLISHLIHPK